MRMRKRLGASLGLVIAAYFAAATAFHQHELPRPVHEHAGFCSQESASAPLESCAICKATSSAARLEARVPLPGELAPVTERCAVIAPPRVSATVSFPADPRAPPSV